MHVFCVYFFCSMYFWHNTQCLCDYTFSYMYFWCMFVCAYTSCHVLWWPLIFRKRALWLEALLRKETCNLRHLMHLCHPEPLGEECVCGYIFTHVHKCTYIFTRKCGQKFTHQCDYVFTHNCGYIFTHKCCYIFTQKCDYVFTYKCGYIFTNKCGYIFTNVHEYFLGLPLGGEWLCGYIFIDVHTCMYVCAYISCHVLWWRLIFRKRALWLVALLRKETCYLRHPIHHVLWWPFGQVCTMLNCDEIFIHVHKYMFVCVCVSRHVRSSPLGQLWGGYD